MNLGLEAGEQIRSTGTTGQQGPTGGTPCKLVGGQWAAGSDLTGRRRNKLDTAPRRSTRREARCQARSTMPVSQPFTARDRTGVQMSTQLVRSLVQT